MSQTTSRSTTVFFAKIIRATETEALEGKVGAWRRISETKIPATFRQLLNNSAATLRKLPFLLRNRVRVFSPTLPISLDRSLEALYVRTPYFVRFHRHLSSVSLLRQLCDLTSSTTTVTLMEENRSIGAGAQRRHTLRWNTMEADTLGPGKLH
ncbi:hypothetical protein E4U15_002826 [Claviceps sp. LM218 group G6]|nr:hypothetical protein E4U15_002826 [Claviceps sp. LM218 group G6]